MEEPWRRGTRVGNINEVSKKAVLNLLHQLLICKIEKDF